MKLFLKIFLFVFAMIIAVGEVKSSTVVNAATTYAIQRTDYYPSGLPYPSMLNPQEQPYKFNGKEFDTMHGLNMYDYSARHYDAAIARWHVPDALAEKYYSISPYAYAGNNPVNRIDPTGMDWYEFQDKDKNTQNMWRNSQDKTYTDDSGNIWNNIGENFLSVNSNNATLFTQHKNDNGELSLRSSAYNLENQMESGNLSSALGDILSASSSIAGVAGLSENSKATFRLTNSKGALDFKFYGNGWKGNQYVTPTSMSNLGKVVSKAGRVAGLFSIGISANAFRQSTTMEGRMEHGLDAFMGGLGFVPVLGTGISVFWSFGGKHLHYKWTDEVLTPALQMGLPPYSYTPTKY